MNIRVEKQGILVRDKNKKVSIGYGAGAKYEDDVLWLQDDDIKKIEKEIGRKMTLEEKYRYREITFWAYM